MQPQDQIREVDGRSLQGMAFNEAVALLRGEIGTDVTLTVYRPSENREFEVTLTRVRVELPTVDSRLIEDIGYARLYTFNGNATTLLEEAVSELIDQGAEALILDLRGNPGGLLDQAIGVSDLFLGDGVVVKQRSRSGQEIVYRSEDGDLGESIPLIVLVDAGSASASEVVAGAIRDRERGVLLASEPTAKARFSTSIPCATARRCMSPMRCGSRQTKRRSRMRVWRRTSRSSRPPTPSRARIRCWNARWNTRALSFLRVKALTEPAYTRENGAIA